MKQILIKVIVPQNGGVWKINVGKGRPRIKKNAVGVFRYVEQFLSQKQATFSASEVGIKIKVVVDHSALHNERPMSWISEGIYSRKNETLYMLTHFLEDYLSERYRRQKEKMFGDYLIESEESACI